jgi:hypothetical protein
MHKSWRIGEHKAIELNLWNRLIHGDSFLAVWSFDIFYRSKGDHAPEFNFTWVVWNRTLIEFNWYDTRHRDSDEFAMTITEQYDLNDNRQIDSNSHIENWHNEGGK